MRVPFTVYADFESFTPQLSTCQPNPEKSYTNQYHKHIPSGFCYHMKCFNDTLYSQQPVTFVKNLAMMMLHKYLLNDSDMLLMIESGIRGEIATISHRHAKTNNEYMGAEFDPTKDFKCISYLDANNRYGWAMSKQLPTSEFKWMTNDELDDWKHLSCTLKLT